MGLFKQDCEFDSVGVLAHIISYCVSNGIKDLGFTKGQKLLYCCYGVVLASTGKRLTKDHPKAWQYGPAFPRAYRAHRNGAIDFDKDPIASDGCPVDIRKAVDATLGYFGHRTASQLVSWSHEQGSPWSVCSNGGTNLYGDIDDSIIRSYFKTQVLAK